MFIFFSRKSEFDELLQGEKKLEFVITSSNVSPGIHKEIIWEPWAQNSLEHFFPQGDDALKTTHGNLDNQLPKYF